MDESNYVVDDGENMEDHLVFGTRDGDEGVRYFGPLRIVLRMMMVVMVPLLSMVMMIMMTW